MRANHRPLTQNKAAVLSRPFCPLSQFANFLSVASSVLGGAILQVFLSPPAVVTADAAADPVAFGWCAELLACPAWQRSWQLSCVVAFCFVFLSIIGCATAAVASTSTYSLAAAILFFLASFMATAAAVLSIVFLSFSKAICIATSALLVGLLLTSVLLSWDGLMMGLDDVVLGPRLWKAAARGDLAAVRRYIRMGANPNWGGRVPDCLSTEQRMNVVFYAAEHHHYIGEFRATPYALKLRWFPHSFLLFDTYPCRRDPSSHRNRLRPL